MFLQEHFFPHDVKSPIPLVSPCRFQPCHDQNEYGLGESSFSSPQNCCREIGGLLILSLRFSLVLAEVFLREHFSYLSGEHSVVSCGMFLRERFLHTNSLACTANLIALVYEADYAAG